MATRTLFSQSVTADQNGFITPDFTVPRKFTDLSISMTPAAADGGDTNLTMTLDLQARDNSSQPWVTWMSVGWQGGINPKTGLPNTGPSIDESITPDTGKFMRLVVTASRSVTGQAQVVGTF